MVKKKMKPNFVTSSYLMACLLMFVAGSVAGQDRTAQQSTIMSRYAPLISRDAPLTPRDAPRPDPPWIF